MVGKLDVWANRTVLEEDMMIAEKIERPVQKLSVTIGLVAETFATGALQAQAVGNVFWRWSENNMEGSFSLTWFLSELPIPGILVDVNLIQVSIHTLSLAKMK